MAASYTVTNITATVGFDANNQPTRGTDVTFETVPSGIAGLVHFDDANPTPDAVDQAIVPEAKRLEAIKAL